MPDTLCKVCGLTRREDVLLCHELGVDFTGFIFAAFRGAACLQGARVSLPDAPG